MNNEPLGSYERNIMKTKIEIMVIFLEARAEAAENEKKINLEHISESEILYSGTLDYVIEMDAKYYASKFALNHLKSIIEGGEFYDEFESDEMIKVLRDRIMYEITRGYEARSTSASSNHIQNARHFAMINLLNEI